MSGFDVNPLKSKSRELLSRLISSHGEKSIKRTGRQTNFSNERSLTGPEWNAATRHAVFSVNDVANIRHTPKLTNKTYV